MQRLSFVIPVAPRTKKTSNVIIRRRGEDGRQLGACPMCGQAQGQQMVLPSEPFREWFKWAMHYAAVIRGQLAAAGVELPVRGPVSVTASFYRESLTGDYAGFIQALGDWLQAPMYYPPGHKKFGRLKREGAGIIADDKQIQHWDGTRLLKDGERPRVEVTVHLLPRVEDQEELF